MPSASDNPTSALNEVLSEVIDVVQDVKQARRKVPQADALHPVLDNLLADLLAWAGLLMERDQLLGISALATMPSVAGRTPPNLWPGEASDDDVRRLVDEHLGRLAECVWAAMAVEGDSASRAVLGDIESRLRADRQALAGPPTE